MRRQRFPHTLTSEDESSFLLDSDNLSVLSSSLSYSEPIWPQIISPEPDSSLPYYVYQYPFLQIPAEAMPIFPGSFNMPLCSETFNVFDDHCLYNTDLNNIYSPANVDPDSFLPFGDYANVDDIPSCIYVPAEETFSNIHQDELTFPKTFPKVSNDGTVTLLLRHLIRLDISPTKAVRVTNPPAECIASVNGVGDKSCVIHPNGRVLHIGEDVHIKTLDRQAKICRRGIIFSSLVHCLSYRVDDSGTKTTSEKFRNLDHDFSLEDFYSTGLNEKSSEECQKMVNEAIYKSFHNGDEVWEIGGFRIKQDQGGDVKITKNGDRCAIKTSPTSGQITTKTFSTEIRIGRYPDCYFSVKKDNKEVTASLNRFVVKHGTQKSGFNSSGKVALF